MGLEHGARLGHLEHNHIDLKDKASTKTLPALRPRGIAPVHIEANWISKSYLQILGTSPPDSLQFWVIFDHGNPHAAAAVQEGFRLLRAPVRCAAAQPALLSSNIPQNCSKSEVLDKELETTICLRKSPKGVLA